MPGKAQPRVVRVAMGVLGVCIGALSRKAATGCGRLRAHWAHVWGHMGTMFWLGMTFAAVALLVLLFKGRGGRRGGGGDGGYIGSDGNGRDHDGDGSDGGGDGGGGD